MSTAPVKSLPSGVQVKSQPAQPAIKGSKGSGTITPGPAVKGAGVKGTGNAPGVVSAGAIKSNSAKASLSHASKVTAGSKMSAASRASTAQVPIKAQTIKAATQAVKAMPVRAVTSSHTNLPTTLEHETQKEAIRRAALEHGRRLSGTSVSYRTSSASTRTDPVPRGLSAADPSPLALPSSSPSPVPRDDVPQRTQVPSYPKEAIQKAREAILAKYGNLAAWSTDTDLDIEVRSNDHVVRQRPFHKALVDLKLDTDSADAVVQAASLGSDVSMSKFFNLLTEGFTESVVKVQNITVQAVNGVRAVVSLSPGESEEKVIMSTAARLGIRTPCDVQVVDGQGRGVSLTYGRVVDGCVYFIKTAKRPPVLVEAGTSTASLVSLAEAKAAHGADCATSTASLKPVVELFERSMQSPPQKRIPPSAEPQVAHVQTETDALPQQLEYEVSASQGSDPHANAPEVLCNGEKYSEKVLRAEREVSTVGPVRPPSVHASSITPGVVNVLSTASAQNRPRRFATPVRAKHYEQPMPTSASDLIAAPPLHHVVHEHTSPTYSNTFGLAFGERLRSERLRRSLPYEEVSVHMSPTRGPPAPTPTPELTPLTRPVLSAQQHVAWSPQRMHPAAAPAVTASYQTYEVRVARDSADAPLGLRVVGVVVEGISSRGPAERAGIRPGMLIHSVDGESVSSNTAIQERLAASGNVTNFLVSVP